MHLAVDIGNTQIAIGLYGDASWRARWRLKTDPRRTSDEYRIMLAELFADLGIPAPRVEAVTMSSVVPELAPVFGSVSETLFGIRALDVQPGVRTGMEVRYEPPQSLGPDRLANAVAARAGFGAPVVAVDFGTATTFSVVGEDGAFVGGAIAPGIGVAAAALAASGARLRRIDLMDRPGSVPHFGRNTETSMRAGIIHGYAGLVNGLLRRMAEELGTAPSVVATGGLAATVAPLVRRIDTVDLDLTLEGLRQIGEHNAEERQHR